MNKPSFYAVIPASVRYDESLSSSEKLFYAEITAMSEKEGYCWASNFYFSELFGVSKNTVTRWVSNLKENGHVVVNLIRDGKQITKREIYPINKIDGTYPQKCSEGTHKNVDTPTHKNGEDNTTRVNTTSNNNYVQFVDFWNEVNDCNLRITDKKREQIRARLRTYSEDELKESIRNRSEDDWINSDGKKYKKDWNSFWRNDEKVERYLHKENTNEVYGNKLRGL